MNKIISRQDAKAAGLKRFFTGVKCLHEHISERYVSTGTCCKCIKLHRDNWALSNKEWIYNYQSSYRKDPVVAGKHRECSRKYHWKNRDKIIEKNKNKYEKNFLLRKEKVACQNKYARDLRGSEPIRYYLYRAICNHNRRCLKQNVPGRLTYKGVLNILELQEYRCFTCSSPLNSQSISLDHWMPIALGGTNEHCNIKFLCNFCNFSKNDKHPDVWIKLNATPTIPRKSSIFDA